MMQGRPQSWGGGLQQCKYLKECHFNLMLEVERAVSARGICDGVFIPSRECVLAACACVRGVAATSPYHLLTHLLPSKTEHPPHHPPSPTHPPNFSCLMSPHQRPIQPQLSFPFSLHGFLALCRAGLARVQQPSTLPLYHSAIQRLRKPCYKYVIPKGETIMQL